MSETIFDPKTPREALLVIREMTRRGGNITFLNDEIRTVAEAGLQGRADVELSDALADRLARAHQLLGSIRNGGDLAVLSGDIDEALCLPPDLEAMVERRR
jgi:hypothetical protein